ncbi:ATP-binding cassette domain-containing protein [Propionimicrobium sp. PCR01-08-3]|uniref:AAA family ATPase n=1 Tax=Propionimicrobium sp. PCR01-08-3 TaxID=3052086 RepID=UPI00255D0E2C|nr:ATP-binding cassette domain-containing protein [Propionimicrobium sp. PCR01-08-3]WIY83997.1 ATP-binding cassette domain-containing protein [Propionimicrobium sp. PCR01-08-3]
MNAFSALPVREIVAAPIDDERRGWPFSMAPVAQLLRDGLELTELTILVGENGVGKSTIIEAVAMAYGLSAEGGSTNERPSDRPTESRLHEHLALIRGIRQSRWGYFVRAETMHGLLTYLEEHPGADAPYHELSHGQAFNALLDQKLVHMAGRGGFLVLDEPEAGLSFMSQITLANQIGGLRDEGIQVLMATHSPILAAIPGAQIVELDETGFCRREWKDLMSVALYRRFLDDPGYFGLE